MDIQEEMDDVANALQIAKIHNLEVEVITWALKAMKENNTLPIGVAMMIGLGEWVK